MLILGSQLSDVKFTENNQLEPAMVNLLWETRCYLEDYSTTHM